MIIWYSLSSQRSHLIGQLVLLLMTMLCLKRWLLKYVLRALVGRSVKIRNNCRDTMESLKHQWIVTHSIIGNKVNNFLTISKFIFWVWAHGYHFLIIIKLVTGIFHPRNLMQQAPIKLWLAFFLLRYQIGSHVSTKYIPVATASNQVVTVHLWLQENSHTMWTCYVGQAKLITIYLIDSLLLPSDCVIKPVDDNRNPLKRWPFCRQLYKNISRS